MGTEVILTIDQRIYRENEQKIINYENVSTNKKVLVVNQDKKVNETLKRLKEIDSDIPCIILLDSNKEKIRDHYLKDGFKDYLMLNDLRNKLKRIIDKY